MNRLFLLKSLFFAIVLATGSTSSAQDRAGLQLELQTTAMTPQEATVLAHQAKTAFQRRENSSPIPVVILRHQSLTKNELPSSNRSVADKIGQESSNPRSTEQAAPGPANQKLGHDRLTASIDKTPATSKFSNKKQQLSMPNLRSQNGAPMPGKNISQQILRDANHLLDNNRSGPSEKNAPATTSSSVMSPNQNKSHDAAPKVSPQKRQSNNNHGRLYTLPRENGNVRQGKSGPSIDATRTKDKNKKLDEDKRLLPPGALPGQPPRTVPIPPRPSQLSGPSSGGPGAPKGAVPGGFPGSNDPKK